MLLEDILKRKNMGDRKLRIHDFAVALIMPSISPDKASTSMKWEKENRRE
jgi:hypothetical protein